MNLCDHYRKELIQLRGEPTSWVLINRQGIHWDDFSRMVTGRNDLKERFFRSLEHAREFESKEQLVKMYQDWLKGL